MVVLDRTFDASFYQLQSCTYLFVYNYDKVGSFSLDNRSSLVDLGKIVQNVIKAPHTKLHKGILIHIGSENTLQCEGFFQGILTPILFSS